jgi:hypothetical protein
VGPKMTAKTVSPTETAKPENHKQLALVSLVGTGLIIIGSVLPVARVVFSPPQGYAVVDGVRLYAYDYTAFVLFSSSSPSDLFDHLKPALGALIVSNLLFDLPVLLVNNDKVIAILTHRITQALFGSVKGLATVVQCVGTLVVAYILLNYGRASLTDLITPSSSSLLPSADLIITSPSEYIAGQFLHVSLGVGFYFLIVGYVIAMVMASMNVGARIAALLMIIVVVLFCTGGFDILTNLFQFLDQLDPLKFMGL